MKKLFLFFVLIYFGQSAIYGQGVDLGMHQQFGIDIPDTVVANNSYSVTVAIINNDTADFVGPLNVVLGVDSAQNGVYVPVQSDSLLLIQLVAGDTTVVSLSHFISLNDYKLEGNGIAIWPAGPNVNTTDSVFKDVYVVIESGVKDEEQWEGYEAISMYPNPTNQYVYITDKGTGRVVEQVRIYDLRGAIIEILGATTTIDLSTINPGVYLVEVDFGKMRKKTFRIIKQ